MYALKKKKGVWKTNFPTKKGVLKDTKVAHKEKYVLQGSYQ